MDPTHVRCSCVMRILTACILPQRSHPREQQEHHDAADLCWHTVGFLKSRLKVLFFYKRKKPIRRYQSAMTLQHPTVPHTGLVGGKWGTHGMQPLCQTALLKA